MSSQGYYSIVMMLYIHQVNLNLDSLLYMVYKIFIIIHDTYTTYIIIMLPVDVLMSM